VKVAPVVGLPIRLAIGLVALVYLVVMLGCREGGAAQAHAGALPDAGTRQRLVSFEPTSLARLGIRVEPAGTATATQVLRVPGTLDYNLDKYADIGTLLEGRVKSLAARLGDSVTKGQVLGTIVVPSIANAQADYLTANAAATAARKNTKREEDLLTKELTTAREAEVALSEGAKADANVAAAASRLRALPVSLPDNDSVVAAAGTYRLVSPIAGIIVKREAVLGRFLVPNETAFVVADLSELWATLEIFESDLPYLQAGAEVDIAIDAIPNKIYEGRIALLEPQIGSSSRAARARVVVPNKDGQLRPGLFIRAAIELPAQALGGRLLVPAGAVQPLGDEDVVFVEKGEGKYEVRSVKTARRTAEVAEIVEGLSKGERIVVEAAFLLRGEVTRQ
jgi:membrane fusion protein, heavy metal efflux system